MRLTSFYWRHAVDLEMLLSGSTVTCDKKVLLCSFAEMYLHFTNNSYECITIYKWYAQYVLVSFSDTSQSWCLLDLNKLNTLLESIECPQSQSCQCTWTAERIETDPYHSQSQGKVEASHRGRKNKVA